MTVLPSLYVN